MPAESCEVGSVEAIVGVNEGIDEILGPLGDMPLHHFRRVHCDLLLLPEGILRFGIVDDFQSIVVDLYPIRESPHLIKLILVLADYYLPVYVVLQNTHLQLVALDLVHREGLLGKGVL